MFNTYSLSSGTSSDLVCIRLSDCRRTYIEKIYTRKCGVLIPLMVPPMVSRGDESVRDAIKWDLKQILQMNQISCKTT